MIEVVVASSISIIIFAAIFALYASANDIWQVKGIQSDLQASARNALSQMSDELKETTSTKLNVSVDQTYINFTLPSSTWNGTSRSLNFVAGSLTWDDANLIQYKLANDVIAGRKILSRIQTNATSSTSRTLARDVSSVQFSSPSTGELEIVLTLSKPSPAQRNITTQSVALVKMRN